MHRANAVLGIHAGECCLYVNDRWWLTWIEIEKKNDRNKIQVRSFAEVSLGLTADGMMKTQEVKNDLSLWGS